MENIASLIKIISSESLKMPQAQLLKEEDITLADVTTHIIDFSYMLQENNQHKQILLLPATDLIYKIEFDGSEINYANNLTLYREFLDTLSLDKVTVTSLPPTGEVISLPDVGFKFTLPAGWKGSKNGSIFHYSPPDNIGLNGVEFTIKALKKSKKTPNATEAARQFRMSLPLSTEVIKLADSEN